VWRKLGRVPGKQSRMFFLSEAGVPYLLSGESTASCPFVGTYRMNSTMVKFDYFDYFRVKKPPKRYGTQSRQGDL